MTATVPRPLVFVGVPALLALFGVALWAWLTWGEGVFFDSLAGGIAGCS